MTSERVERGDFFAGSEGRVLRLEESVSGLRDRTSELAQSQARDERELNNLDQRLRELEGQAISLASEQAGQGRELGELGVLRERLSRLSQSVDEQRESGEAGLRVVHQELDAQREGANAAARRLQAQEKSDGELRERLTVYDDAIRRVNGETSDGSHRISQLENGQSALGARIGANADGLRRAAAEGSALETRVEALERRLGQMGERLELSFQSLRRVEETAEQWEDLKGNVDALRSRVEESLKALDASRAVVSAVQRGFETVEEQIGGVERMVEQLRVRDARRERAVASLGDKIEGVETTTAQEQERFVALQEQVRRRQIEELEQEIRELKAYLRVRSDV